MFGLGENTFKAWENLEAKTGSLKNRMLNCTAYKIDCDKLLQWYCKNAYSTNEETAIACNCSISGMRNTKKNLGITRKKILSNTVSEAGRVHLR